MSRALGWRPDPPKDVAEDFSASQVLKASRIPKSASNRELVDILDQGNLGSCTANAAMQAIRASQLVHGAPADVEFGSRLFAYYFARALTHETGVDSGTYLRAIFEVTNKFGFCPESAWEYDDNPNPETGRFTRMPGMRAMRAAYDQRSPTEYRRIYETGDDRLTIIKRALANRQLVVFGTDVTEDFCENNFDPGATIKPPGDAARMAGGHAMAIAGYEEIGNTTVFEIPNSWGEGWGEQGWCRFDGSYLTHPMSRDFWIVKSAPNFLPGNGPSPGQ